jgi:hypothetical protein
MVENRLPFFRLGQLVAGVCDAKQKALQVFVGVILTRGLANCVGCRGHAGT